MPTKGANSSGERCTPSQSGVVPVRVTITPIPSQRCCLEQRNALSRRQQRRESRRKRRSVAGPFVSAPRAQRRRSSSPRRERRKPESRSTGRTAASPSGPTESGPIKSRRRKTGCGQRGWVATTRSRLRLDPEKQWANGPARPRRETKVQPPARATRKNGSLGPRGSIACPVAGRVRPVCTRSLLRKCPRAR